MIRFTGQLKWLIWQSLANHGNRRQSGFSPDVAVCGRKRHHRHDVALLSSPQTAPAASMRQLRLPAGRLLTVTALFIALSYLGFYVIYDRLAGRALTFDARLLDWRVLLAAGTLLVVYFAADGLRLYYTLRALHQHIALRNILPLVFINIFFSHTTPLATGGGFAQIWYLQSHGVRIGTAAAATTIRTVLAMLLIFSLAPVFLLTLKPLADIPLLSDIAVPLSTLIVIYLVCFIVMLVRTRWLIAPLILLLQGASKLKLISASRHRRWHYRCRREMLQLARSFGRYVHGRPLDVILSVLFTAVFLISLFSFPALLISALEYDIGYLLTVGLTVVTTFIMYFSPTPGAAGISEGVFGSFFSDILTPNHLVLVTLGWRFLTVYLGMLIGLVIMQWLLLRRQGKT